MDRNYRKKLEFVEKSIKDLSCNILDVIAPGKFLKIYLGDEILDCTELNLRKN